MISAGEIKERITWLQHSLVNPDPEDDYGNPVSSYSSEGTFWAKVDQVPAAESFEEQLVSRSTQIRVTLRRSSETEQITDKDRIRWRSVDYDISQVSIDHNDRDKITLEAISVA